MKSINSNSSDVKPSAEETKGQGLTKVEPQLNKSASQVARKSEPIVGVQKQLTETVKQDKAGDATEE